MLEMLKSKTIVGFILLVFAFTYIGGVNNETKTLETKETNNVLIVNE